LLYPETGFAKTRRHRLLLADCARDIAAFGRPAADIAQISERVDGKSFFEKNAPVHTPKWVRTVRLPVLAAQ